MCIMEHNLYKKLQNKPPFNCIYSARYLLFCSDRKQYSMSLILWNHETVAGS